MNQLDQLKRLSIIAVHSADMAQIAAFAPRDATANCSLILQAARRPEYAPLLRQVIAAHDKRPRDKTIDELLVRVGVEMLGVVAGRISTEIDPRLSFDTGATVARAQRVADLYGRAGIGRERVLVKIAATWEGIQAAKALEHMGIHCNLTLVLSLAQAVACGDAGVTLISPFVGRVGEWHRKAGAAAWDEAAHGGAADPGVRHVAQIYNYFKKFGLPTEVMAASLRSTAQVLALAGCDLLAIGPALLGELQAADEPVVRRLDPQSAQSAAIHALTLNEASFRYALNDDAMATETLAAGIRAFAADVIKLEKLVESAP